MADQPTRSRTTAGTRTHELPPELQDRPEQNRGYDEAVGGTDTVELDLDPDADDTERVDLDERTTGDERP